MTRANFLPAVLQLILYVAENLIFPPHVCGISQIISVPPERNLPQSVGLRECLQCPVQTLIGKAAAVVSYPV